MPRQQQIQKTAFEIFFSLSLTPITKIFDIY